MTNRGRTVIIPFALSRSRPLLTPRIPFRPVQATDSKSMYVGGWFHPPAFSYAEGRNHAWRCVHIAAELLINEEIRDREVRLIGADGAQLGVLPIARALELAEEAELDLVKIVPTAQPPVCKLMDYDKHRYEQSKREREMRKNQKTISVKEVQLSATIEENDVQTKAKNAIKFLQGGDKVKVSIRFRGRQITHSEIGLKVMQDFIDRTKDVAVVEKRPALDGRHMIMILGPKADKPVKAPKPAKPAEGTDA